MFDAPEMKLPQTPNAPQKPPMFGEKPNSSQKPKPKSTTPTFLGTGTVPEQSQLGGKTLLGQ